MAQAEDGTCQGEGVMRAQVDSDESRLGQRSGVFPQGRGGENEPLWGAGQIKSRKGISGKGTRRG